MFASPFGWCCLATTFYQKAANLSFVLYYIEFAKLIVPYLTKKEGFCRQEFEYKNDTNGVLYQNP